MEGKSSAQSWIEVISIAVSAFGMVVIAAYTFSFARSTKKLWDEARSANEIANATADGKS